MPSRNVAPKVPSYRRHKPSGQAVVTLDGAIFTWASGARRRAEPSMID